MKNVRFRITVATCAALLAITAIPPIARQITSEFASGPSLPIGLQQALKHHSVPASKTNARPAVPSGSAQARAVDQEINGTPGAVPIFTKTTNKYPPAPPASHVKIVDTPVKGTDSQSSTSAAHYVAGKSKEIVGLRQANTQVYLNPDGTKTAVVHTQPIFYKSGSKWKSISTDLVRGPDGRYHSRGTALQYSLAPATAKTAHPATANLGQAQSGTSPTGAQTGASAGGSSAKLTSVITPLTPTTTSTVPAATSTSEPTAPSTATPSDSNIASVRLDPMHSIGFGLSGSSAVTGVADGSTMTYPSVESGVSLKLSPIATGLKEAIVLSSSSAAQSFVFPLKMTNLMASLDSTTGQVDFRDLKTGQTVAYVPHGWMVDSKVDPVSKEGAVSDGVTYSLIQFDGGSALQVTLDSSWLDSPSRVYPVTVDPTVVASALFSADSDSTFVTSGFNANNSTNPTLQLGTYDGGTNVSAIYDHFSGLSAYANDHILGATLWGWNSSSWSCQARGVGVYRVTQPWSASTMTTYPGAAYDGSVDWWSSFANGYTGCAAGWGTWDVTPLVNEWASGAEPNYGLTIRADPVSLTDDYAFKTFSAASQNGQFMQITYSSYNASYSVGNVITEPTNNAAGAVNVSVTNLGHDAWPANGTIRLSYHLYTASGTLVTFDGARTFMPTTVNPGQSISLNAVIAPMSPGNYSLIFDMVDDGTTWFSASPGPEVPYPPPDLLTVYNVPPAISGTTPLSQIQLTTPTPTLGVTATDPDNYPGTPLTYAFDICTGLNYSGTCYGSGAISSPTWTVPSGDLFWHTNYYWVVWVKDGAGGLTISQFSSLALVVPQPTVGSHLGSDPFSQSSGGVNPATGNYLYQTTDATVDGVGPPLGLDRSYNSQNSSNGSFGTGWSSIADLSIQKNSIGALVTFDDGHQDQFGLNPDGSYAPGPGPFSTLQNVFGYFVLTATDGTSYAIDPWSKLTWISDSAGHKLNFTYAAPTTKALTEYTNTSVNGGLGDAWATVGSQPSGYSSPTSLGSLSTTQVNGTVPIYQCLNTSGSDSLHFLSLSSACSDISGSVELDLEGYIYSSSIPGGEQLTRCSPQNNRNGASTEIVEVNSNCGPQTSPTFLGYTIGTSTPELNLATITNAANGRNLSFTWTGSHVTNVSTSSTGSGGPISWTYTYNGTLLTSACAQTTPVTCTSYGYTTDGASTELGTITLPTGNTYVTLGYGGDGSGSVAWRQDGAGNKWTYAALTAFGYRQETITDPNANTEIWLFNGNGDLLSQQNENGKTQSYTWDSQGNLDVVTDPNGNQLMVAHDQRGNISSRLNYVGGYAQGGGRPVPGNQFVPGTSYYTYFLSGNSVENDRLLTSSDPRSTSRTDTSYETQYTYNSLAELTSKSLPPPTSSAASPTTTWTYSVGTEAAVDGGTIPAGLELTQTDPTGGVTHFSYYSNGDLAQQVNPVGLTTNYAYDGIGRLVTKTVISDAFPAGTTTTYTYDRFNRVLTETAPATVNAVTGQAYQQRTTTVYDGDGNVTSSSVSDVLGTDATRTTTKVYDADNRILSTTDPNHLTTSYTYDQLGNIATLTKPNGAVYAETYTPTNQLATVTLDNFIDNPVNPGTPRNVVLASFAYDPGGRLASQTDALGRTTAYTYYSNNQLDQTTLDSFVNPDGSTRNVLLDQKVYDAAGNLIDDLANNWTQRTQYNVNPDNEVSSAVFDPNGIDRTTSYGYDQNGNTTSVTQSGASGSAATSYTYNLANAETSQSVANGAQNLITTLTRNELGELTSVNDPRGYSASGNTPAYTTSYTYDQLGNQTSVIDPPVSTEQVGGSPSITQPTTTTGFDSFGDAVNTEDPNGNVTTKAYNGDSKLKTTTAPSYTVGGKTITPTTTQNYNSLEQVDSITDPNGNVTTTTYDLRGRPVQVVNPQVTGQSSPGTTTLTYDDVNNLLSTTDPTGAVTEATYNDRNWPVTRSQVERTPTLATLTTQLQYDDQGDVTGTTLPDGETSTATYNAADEITSSKNALNGATTYAYDFEGNPLSMTDPLGRVTSNTFSEDGTLTSTTHSANGTVLSSEQFGYDPAGNQTGVTSPNGVTSTFGYDALNRLTSITQPTSATASDSSSYGYNADSEQTRMTDGNGNSTTTSYNTLNLPASVVEPPTAAYTTAANRTWTTTYDASGNPLTVTAPGGTTTTASYDQLNQLVSESGTGSASDTAATASTSVSYDLDGRTTSVSTPTGSQTFSYNDRGLPVSSTGPEGSSSFVYNGDGQLTSRSDAAGTAQFGYNANGSMTSLTDPNTGSTDSETYNADGQPNQITYGANGAAESYGYDGLGRTTSDSVTSSTGSVLRSATYGYDPNSNLTSETVAPSTVAGAGSSTYGYSEANQLTSWSGPSGTTNYTYDSAGNLLTQGPTSYAYDSRNEQVSSTTGTSQTTNSYSARGTLESATTGTSATSYQFDAFNRMVSAGSTTLTYDGLNRIASANGSTFSYAGTSQNASSDGSTRYLRTPVGGLVSESSNGSNVNSLSNVHGDVIGQLTASGSGLTGSASYNPFGQPTASTGTAIGSIGYQGGWTDPATGMVNMETRFYNPSGGSFISQDSAGVPQQTPLSANLFAYVNNNPMSNIDPTGQYGLSLPEWMGGVAAGLEVAGGVIDGALALAASIPLDVVVAAAALIASVYILLTPTALGDGTLPATKPAPASTCQCGSHGGAGGGTYATSGTSTYVDYTPAVPAPPPLQVAPDAPISPANLAPHPVVFKPTVGAVQLGNDAAPSVTSSPAPAVAKTSQQPQIFGDQGVCASSGLGAMAGCLPAAPTPPVAATLFATGVAASGASAFPSLPPNSNDQCDSNNGGKSNPKSQEHHIATNKFPKSLRKGGPWTPRFQAIFDKAGMSLNDPSNIVSVLGHKGPHPREYHQAVYDRLKGATQDATGADYEQRLRAELNSIANDAQTSGSQINDWLTNGCS